MNRFRLVPLEFIDQLIMGFGGLRGAVAYGLAVMMDENKIKEKNLMVSTTLIVVFFTVIVQVRPQKPYGEKLGCKWSETKTSHTTSLDKSIQHL